MPEPARNTPELRHDALTGRLVLLATDREARPITFTHHGAERDVGDPSTCPFCPGHERATPPEITRTGPGAPDSPGWRVRVVPNLYPIAGGPHAGTSATGAHEVVVLSPDHGRSLAELADDQAVEVLTVLRDRARAHTAAGHAHVQVLVNQGRAAGASIAHPHAQVIALDFVPPAVSVATERFAAAGSDLVLDDLSDANARSQCVVSGPEVAAWCPSGSASPFEVRIAALNASGRFDEAGDGQVLGVAIVLRDVLAAIATALGSVPYNVVVHTAHSAARATYHWWVEVLPRVAVVAGFELGTGVLVNTVAPDAAAARLRGLS
jgi:UDPglucose--hexose-1-phosphate uridylyltransferase